MRSLRLQYGSKALAFLKSVQSDDPCTYEHLLDILGGWADDITRPDEELIAEILVLLRNKPKLLHDFNAMLPMEDYRIEFSTDRRSVDLVTLIAPSGPRILSTSKTCAIPPSPYVTDMEDLRRAVSSEIGQRKLVQLKSEWASCTLELLQTVRTTTTELDGKYPGGKCDAQSVLRCLRGLARNSGEFPPSLFLRNITRLGNNPVRGGGFGDTYEGVLNGKRVGLKVLRVFATDCIGTDMVTSFCHEALVWRQIHHRNVLPLYGVSKELFPSGLCLVSPWMSRGHIMDYIDANPTCDRLASIVQIAEGLRYLHEFSPNIVHGDIRGANILVDDNLTCMLADFGLASVIETQSTFNPIASDSRAALRWMAPELLDPSQFPNCGRNATLASDIYAFGCTIYEILTGTPPFSDIRPDSAVVNAIVQGIRPQRPPPGLYCPGGVWLIVKSCLAHHPKDRPDVGLILEALGDFCHTSNHRTDPAQEKVVAQWPSTEPAANYITKPVKADPSSPSVYPQNHLPQQQSTPPLYQPSHFDAHYTPFVPGAGLRPQQQNGPPVGNPDLGPGSRSPVCPRPSRVEETKDCSLEIIDEQRDREMLRIDTTTPELSLPSSDLPRERPGPLGLSSRSKTQVPAQLPSALASARFINDLSRVPYPEGIMSPKIELNINAKDGKFRYDREFLLQFMSVCTEKSDMLPPLDSIGLEPSDQFFSLTRGGSGRHRQPSNPSVTSSSNSPQGVGLGFNPGFGKAGGAGCGPNPFNMNVMGNFTTLGNKLNGEERVMMMSGGGGCEVSGPSGLSFGRAPPVALTVNQDGCGATPGSSMGNNRTQSKRRKKRDGNNKMSGQQGHGSTFGSSGPLDPCGMLEPEPLSLSGIRWVPVSFLRKPMAIDHDSPEIVDRKVKGLLNKLTMEKFDSISDQIIAWANKSEKEKDGRTLIQVIRLVFEHAIDGMMWSEMYARLCRKMMEQISSTVQDDAIKNPKGKPITGGQLFRKYLLNRCQEDFERGWVAKEVTAAAAATKAKEDEAAKASNEKITEGGGGDEEVALYSEEYYATQKAKRQGLGLIKFIGELFKLQMLTERIMHKCVKKLLGNVQNPGEEAIESLCKLLATVGSILDTTKAHAHMDVYFSRMKELVKSPSVSSRPMLQDVIELRERRWVTRNAVAAPTTIAQIHEAAAKEKAAQEKESYQRQMSMSPGGSRRGGERVGDHQQIDGWAVTGSSGPPRLPPKAGDLSNFGKINKPTSGQMTFGPGSVFAGKEGKRETLSRSSSSSMSEAEAKKKIAEDSKEFFGVRNLDEAEEYFSTLPVEHRFRLVDKLVMTAIESKESDAQLVAEFFSRAAAKELCSAASFEEGFMPTAEVLDDIVIDVPKAFQLMAVMLTGAGIDADEERHTRIAAKSMDGGKLLAFLPKTFPPSTSTPTPFIHSGDPWYNWWTNSP